MTDLSAPKAIPFGDPRWLKDRKPVYAPPHDRAAIIVCGGGDPHAEFVDALNLCNFAMKEADYFIGNDMIAEFPDYASHALTLHPDKLSHWQALRRKHGYPMAGMTYWSHRPYTGINHYTRDWSGSTGLFCVKVARELGYKHVILCGVHMQASSGHFVRKVDWKDCTNFMRGWQLTMHKLRPYVRSFGGWTREELGCPTLEWISSPIVDMHQEPAPPGYFNGGLKA
jgi:hypothetical protein